MADFWMSDLMVLLNLLFTDHFKNWFNDYVYCVQIYNDIPKLICFPNICI